MPKHMPTPPYTAPFADRHVGYDTRWATNLVINLMPPGARVVKQPVVTLTSTVGSGVDQDGRTYAKAAVVLPPDGNASLTWTYVVPHAAFVHGDRMSFLDYVAPQSMLRTPTLDLFVVAPKGWTVAAAPGWKASTDGTSTSVPIDHLQVLKVRLHRG